MGFSHDAPIELPRQDRLGRTHFSKALGKALQNWRETESIVIGLFGGWGSGKTSIKNLTLHALKNTKKLDPQIVNFNPWLFSQDEQLVGAFFKEIAVILSRRLPSESEKESSSRLSKFASYLSAFGTAAEPILDLLGILDVPGASIAATTATGVRRGTKIVAELAETEKTLANEAAKTLAELKTDLRAALMGRKHPIFIVIDDIDRLTRNEICLLFRLIKANADFPRFIYLVLCDRQFVTNALEELAPGRGSEFLEKIVQISFDIPEPAWGDIVNIAWNEWLSIRRTSADAVAQSSVTRWSELINYAKPYLRHVRAVRRWMNGVRFSFDLFKTQAGFDANPEDLLALELLRLFEPVLYERLPHFRVFLLGEKEPGAYREEDAKEKNAVRKNELLALVLEEQRSNVESILMWMFPNGNWDLILFGEKPGDLLKALCIGDKRCFDRYFRLSVGQETLSRSEVKRVLSSLPKRAELFAIVQQNIAEGRWRLLIESLEAHSAAVLLHAKTVVGVFFEIGDTVVDWEDDNHTAVRCAEEFITSLLFEMGNVTEFFLDAIGEARGIVLPLAVVCGEMNRHEPSKDGFPSRCLVYDAYPNVLQAMLSKLREVKDGMVVRRLASDLDFLRLWVEMGGRDDVANCLQRRLAGANGLWEILYIGTASKEAKADYVEDVGWLRELIGSAMDAAVRNAERTECDEEQRRLLAIYRGVKHETNGEDGLG